VLPVRYEHLIHIKKGSYPRNKPWRPIGVIPVRYEHHINVKKVKLSLQHAVEAYRCVSCEVRTTSSYKK
jgi:hypothetical protein